MEIFDVLPVFFEESDAFGVCEFSSDKVIDLRITISLWLVRPVPKELFCLQVANFALEDFEVGQFA